jgi:hypothetical protein
MEGGGKRQGALYMQTCMHRMAQTAPRLLPNAQSRDPKPAYPRSGTPRPLELWGVNRIIRRRWTALGRYDVDFTANDEE